MAHVKCIKLLLLFTNKGSSVCSSSPIISSEERRGMIDSPHSRVWGEEGEKQEQNNNISLETCERSGIKVHSVISVMFHLSSCEIMCE